MRAMFRNKFTDINGKLIRKVKSYCTRVEFSELKIPYSTVVVVDFADLEMRSIGKNQLLLRKA